MSDVVANGVRHHVQRLGDARGKKVVFLHGLVMDNLSSFYFTLANPIAAAGADAILYDLRGHGMSERPARGYRVADFVDDLAAILDALHVERATFVGNSFGGTLALAFAAAHPARAAGLALIDAHDGADGWSAQMTATLALRGEARDAKIAESFQAWLGRHSERKRTRLAQHAEALVERTSLVEDLRASPPLDLAALGRVECEALALYGEQSDTRARGEAIARALPRCTLELVPNATHSVMWEATAHVKDRITTWVGASR
ncbi:MAG TPA: alpha/beta fold hydrolase [Kofleriaceae bacterium]|jgi:pimeloyl-ACP methyl ester carboxylesterase|nr:alpha/beta fold hydrolase [Kofleriaceae bacterium]